MDECREDRLLLTTYFVGRAATSIRKIVEVIRDEVINTLVAYDWPPFSPLQRIY